MRLFSTPESSREEEASLLAVLETLAAMTISLFIAVEAGTLKHVVVSACIAPFLLLRTEQSTHIAMAWSIYLLPFAYWIFFPVLLLLYSGLYIRELPNSLGFIYIILLFVIGIPLLVSIWFLVLFIVGSSFFIIRVLSVLLTLIRYPFTTLASIPRNWRKVILCTDMVHPPEVIPDIERENIPEVLEVFRFYEMIDYIYQSDRTLSIEKKALRTLYLMPFIVFWYVPAILYRWSLKNTALIWSPLICIVAPARGNLTIRLKQIRYAAIYKVMRVYSLIVAMLFLAKLYILWSWHELITSSPFWRMVVEAWTRIPNAHVFHAYVVPPEIPPWQLAAFLNTVFVWAAFFVADLLLIRYGEKQPPQEEILHNAFRCLALARNFLSLYIIICTIYITIYLGVEGRWNLPPLGTKLFPWW